MTSYYCVIQFIPDVVRDERVNVGVLTFGDGQVRTRFIKDWTRAETIAGTDVMGLKFLLEDVENLSENDVWNAARNWEHAIQLTYPCGTGKSPDELLNETANRFLVD